MLPAGLVSEQLLVLLYPDIFQQIFQADFMFEIQTSILVPNPEGGEDLLLTWDVNPMIYAWGMALLFGLIMATPMKARWRLLQMLIGYTVVSLVTIWGVFWEVWRDLAFLFGPDVRAVVDASSFFAHRDCPVLPARLPDVSGGCSAGDLDSDEPLVHRKRGCSPSALNRIGARVVCYWQTARPFFVLLHQPQDDFATALIEKKPWNHNR